MDKTRSSDAPLLSIGLPVYNGDKYLAKAIESVLGQTWQDFELIISDNGSMDGTEAICLGYAGKDKRIRYYRSPKNQGMAWNFRQVFKLARAEYFLWAAHDDYFSLDYAERCLDVLRRDPKVVLCYSHTAIVGEGGKQVSLEQDGFLMDPDSPVKRLRVILEKLALCNACFGVMRSKALAQTPVHDNYVGSDIPLLAELALHGAFHEIPETLFFRRVHPGASAQANPTEDQLAVFYDPSQKGVPTLRTWHHLYALIAAVKRAPIGLLEKSRCFAYLARWCRLNRIRLYAEMGDLGRWIFYRFARSKSAKGISLLLVPAILAKDAYVSYSVGSIYL